MFENFFVLNIHSIQGPRATHYRRLLNKTVVRMGNGSKCTL